MMVVALRSIPLGYRKGQILRMARAHRPVNKNFLPHGRRVAVRDHCPRAGRLEPRDHLHDLQSIDSACAKLPEVETTVITIGDDPQVTHNLGSIYVHLEPVDKRKRDQFEIMADVRKNIMPQYARLNLRTSVSPVNAFGGGVNADIMYYIGGPDLKQARAVLEVLLAKLKDMQKIGVVDPDTNFIIGKPELGVRIDRDKAADLGVRVQDIASTLNVLVGGLKVTDYYEGGEQYEVHVRAEHEYRKDPQGIAQAQVPSSNGQPVQLRDIVTMSPGSGPSSINRISRQRQVMLTANVAPGKSAQTIMDQLVADTNNLKMPGEYSSGFTGRSREQGRAFANFLLAFLLSIVFMYLILAAQFESWIHPITILLALPLTVPFALFSILVLNQSLNIFSMLGILVLFGIVKKNGILQVDHTNGLRAHGSAARAGHPRSEPRPTPADSDDDAGFRGRHASAGGIERHGCGDEPRHRLGHHRRPDAGPAADASGNAGGLLVVRRPAGAHGHAQAAEGGGHGRSAGAGVRGVGCILGSDFERRSPGGGRRSFLDCGRLARQPAGHPARRCRPREKNRRARRPQSIPLDEPVSLY